MKSVFDDEIDCKRILREIYILYQLRSKSVIRIFDLIEPEDTIGFNTIYLVLQLAESDLKKVIKSAIYLE
jgi:mitogen-activated protein kinase 1/3